MKIVDVESLKNINVEIIFQVTKERNFECELFIV